MPPSSLQRSEMRVDQGGPSFGSSDGESLHLQPRSILSSAVRHVPGTTRALWCHSHESNQTRLRVDGLDRYKSASAKISGLVAGISMTSSSSCVVTMAQSYSRQFRAMSLDLERLGSARAALVKEARVVESSMYCESSILYFCLSINGFTNRTQLTRTFSQPRPSE